MDIERNEYQTKTSAKERVSFCLDQLEKADGFRKCITWTTDIAHHLTVEEIIGALVSTEQELIEG